MDAEGQHQREDRAELGICPDLDVAVMVPHDAVSEREPKAIAFGLGREERLENVGNVARGDSSSAVRSCANAARAFPKENSNSANRACAAPNCGAAAQAALAWVNAPIRSDRACRA